MTEPTPRTEALLREGLEACFATSGGNAQTPGRIFDFLRVAYLPAIEAHARTEALDERALAADALLTWYETTHGDTFGHDHHCPVPFAAPIPDARCTCGWSLFMREYARLTREETP
jgi:hypothetical protein